jgi:hypothetical protein
MNIFEMRTSDYEKAADYASDRDLDRYLSDTEDEELEEEEEEGEEDNGLASPHGGEELAQSMAWPRPYGALKKQKPKIEEEEEEE